MTARLAAALELWGAIVGGLGVLTAAALWLAWLFGTIIVWPGRVPASHRPSTANSGPELRDTADVPAIAGRPS